MSVLPKRWIFLAGTICMSAAGLGRAETANEWRTWTDRQGTQMEARLTDFNTPAQTVTLTARAGGRVRFPLTYFSVNDQDYIRASRIGRTWVGKNGKTLESHRYGGMDGTRVILLSPSGALTKAEFANLSEADQNLLRRIDAVALPAPPDPSADASATDRGGIVPGVSISPDPTQPEPELINKYAERRGWTICGQSVADAAFVAWKAGKVEIHLSNGGQRTVSFDTLSEADQAYVRDFTRRVLDMTQPSSLQIARIATAVVERSQLQAQDVFLSCEGSILAVTFGTSRTGDAEGLRFWDIASQKSVGTCLHPQGSRLPDRGRQRFELLGDSTKIAFAHVQANSAQRQAYEYHVVVTSLTGNIQRRERVGWTSHTPRFVMRVSPDKKWLAVAGHVWDEQEQRTAVSVAVLNAETLERIQAWNCPVTISDYGSCSPIIAFSPDSQQPAMLYFAQHVGVWDVATGNEVPMFSEVRGYEAIQFGEAGDKLIALRPGGLMSVSLDGKAEPRIMPLRDEPNKAIACSPTQPIFATAGDGQNPDCVIVLRDVVVGTATQLLTGHKKQVTRISFSDNGQRLTSLDVSGEVRVWDVSRF